MKLYIYQLNLISTCIHSLKEYTCEARETEKMFVPVERRCFPRIHLTRIDKEPMPRFHDGSTYVSIEPLSDEQIRNIFIDRRKRTIKGLEADIERENKKINEICMMEVERDAHL